MWCNGGQILVDSWKIFTVTTYRIFPTSWNVSSNGYKSRTSFNSETRPTIPALSCGAPMANLRRQWPYDFPRMTVRKNRRHREYITVTTYAKRSMNCKRVITHQTSSIITELHNLGTRAVREYTIMCLFVFISIIPIISDYKWLERKSTTFFFANNYLGYFIHLILSSRGSIVNY